MEFLRNIKIYCKTITNIKYVLAIMLGFLMINVGSSVALRRNDNLLLGKKLSTFKITINSPPSAEYTQAIQYCASFMETYWVSNVTTVVKVDFDSLGSALARAGATAAIRVGNYQYPIALAKSITDGNIGSGNIARFKTDVQETFDLDTDWYVGTDGRPSRKPNLVSTCIHELLHGLFLIGSGDVSDGNRFDAFLTNKTEDGEYCSVKSFKSEPEKLKQALTNNELYFSDNNRTIAKLYAPKKFSEGSSIYHLDQDTYKHTSNAVMIPEHISGESSHTIGPVIREIEAILRDRSAVPPQKCKHGANPAKNTKMYKQTKVIIIASASIGGVFVPATAEYTRGFMHCASILETFGYLVFPRLLKSILTRWVLSHGKPF